MISDLLIHTKWGAAISLSTCERCHALVESKELDNHYAWHFNSIVGH